MAQSRRHRHGEIHDSPQSWPHFRGEAATVMSSERAVQNGCKVQDRGGRGRRCAAGRRLRGRGTSGRSLLLFGDDLLRPDAAEEVLAGGDPPAAARGARHCDMMEWAAKVGGGVMRRKLSGAGELRCGVISSGRVAMTRRTKLSGAGALRCAGRRHHRRRVLRPARRWYITRCPFLSSSFSRWYAPRSPRFRQPESSVLVERDATLRCDSAAPAGDRGSTGGGVALREDAATLALGAGRRHHRRRVLRRVDGESTGRWYITRMSMALASRRARFPGVFEQHRGRVDLVKYHYEQSLTRRVWSTMVRHAKEALPTMDAHPR